LVRERRRSRMIRSYDTSFQDDRLELLPDAPFAREAQAASDLSRT
jgi:hypothetical protein